MIYEGGPARAPGVFGGLLESTAIGLCSIDDGGGDGGGGSGGGSGGGAAGAALDGAAAALAAAGGGDGGGGEGGGGAGADASGSGADGGAGDGSGDGGAGADADWLERFSAEGGDADNPSNRDWLKAKGFKTLDDVAKSYREAERAIRDGGKISIPADGAKPEEIAAFNKAIGVPDKEEGYEFKLPEGVTNDDLELDLLTGLKGAALKAGVPAKGFAALAEATIAAQLDQLGKMKTAEDGDFTAWKSAQGDQANAKIAAANSAMRALGLTPADVQSMQRGYFLTNKRAGTAWTMNLLSKIGDGIAEDALLGGGGERRFGITGAEAQVEIDRLSKDQEFGKKLINKDTDAVARWNRLNAAVAADRDRKERTAAAG